VFEIFSSFHYSVVKNLACIVRFVTGEFFQKLPQGFSGLSACY